MKASAENLRAALARADHTAAQDVALSLCNWRGFYDVTSAAPRAALAKRLAAGTYDAHLAPFAFAYAVEHAQRSSDWAHAYGAYKPTAADCLAAAAYLVEHYAQEIAEAAADMIGPEHLAVELRDWALDACGNSTARHLVYLATDDGSRRRLVGTDRPRRRQTGTGDYLDACRDAIRRAGFAPDWYDLIGATGRRSDPQIIAHYARRPVALPALNREAAV